MWRTEVIAGAVMRTAGTADGPALWLVHALGESSLSFVPLFSTELASTFELLAPDLPGAGVTPVERHVDGLDALADWLARTIEERTPLRPIGLVGHSLGATIAVRAVRLLSARVVGLFSIEGNLTEADAYLSGEATRFEGAEDFRDHLLRQVRVMAESATPPRSRALWRYHASLTFAAAEALWSLGRSAKAASMGDALGAEYRALPVPGVYYWSPENTPEATQEYLRAHAIPNLTFSGGHWPMVENADQTAAEIGAFFRPLFVGRRCGGAVEQ